jgi:two-component system chemotaxis response regulator CheB
MAIAQRSYRDIIVIGASSGGLEALKEIVAGLPADLPAAVFVVVHVPSQGTSHLPAILKRAGPLDAVHAKDHDPILPGCIYVAPPDFHLLLRPGHVRVVRGPRENNHRPAIDPLFRSAARFYGPRSIGIVLSGALDDGAAGLLSIKRRGGVTIVQNPNDALFSDMPRAALAAGPADHCVTKHEIAKLIVKLTNEQILQEEGATVADQMKKETDLAALSTDTIEDEEKPGKPSVYGCPECGGILWEMQEGEWLRFRCRVGHAFSANGLVRSQAEGLESALWNSFRLLHENAALAKRLAERARGNEHDAVAEKFEVRAQLAEEQAELIRGLLMSGKIKVEAESEAEEEKVFLDRS